MPSLQLKGKGERWRWGKRKESGMEEEGEKKGGEKRGGEGKGEEDGEKEEETSAIQLCWDVEETGGL